MDINVGVTLPNLVFLGEISNQPLNEWNDFHPSTSIVCWNTAGVTC